MLFARWNHNIGCKLWYRLFIISTVGLMIDNHLCTFLCTLSLSDDSIVVWRRLVCLRVFAAFVVCFAAAIDKLDDALYCNLVCCLLWCSWNSALANTSANRSRTTRTRVIAPFILIISTSYAQQNTPTMGDCCCAMSIEDIALTLGHIVYTELFIQLVICFANTLFTYTRRTITQKR